ncbi:MAG: hypothetical protein WAK48_18520 [Candidatus Acidiferrum sp.]
MRVPIKCHIATAKMKMATRVDKDGHFSKTLVLGRADGRLNL